MRTLIVSNLISLDGYASGPDGDVMALPFDTTFSDYNLELMQAEARSLLGTHDFAAFRGSPDRRTTTTRTISVAELSEVAGNPRCLAFEIRGDRFLYHMVRIIVGTLVDVGRGKLAPGAIARAQRSGKRIDLGMTAPPDGLCLEHIELSDSGHDEWPNHS